LIERKNYFKEERCLNNHIIRDIEKKIVISNIAPWEMEGHILFKHTVPKIHQNIMIRTNNSNFIIQRSSTGKGAREPILSEHLRQIYIAMQPSRGSKMLCLGLLLLLQLIVNRLQLVHI